MSEMGPEATVRRFSGALLMAGGGLMALLCGTCTGQLWMSSIRGAFEGATMTSYIDGKTSVTHTPGHFDLGSMVIPGLIGGVPALLGVLALVWGWRVAFQRPGLRELSGRRGIGSWLAMLLGLGLVMLFLIWGLSHLLPAFRSAQTTDPQARGWNSLNLFLLAFLGSAGLAGGAVLFELGRRRR